MGKKEIVVSITMSVSFLVILALVTVVTASDNTNSDNVDVAVEILDVYTAHYRESEWFDYPYFDFKIHFVLKNTGNVTVRLDGWRLYINNSNEVYCGLYYALEKSQDEVDQYSYELGGIENLSDVYIQPGESKDLVLDDYQLDTKSTYGHYIEIRFKNGEDHVLTSCNNTYDYYENWEWVDVTIWNGLSWGEMCVSIDVNGHREEDSDWFSAKEVCSIRMCTDCRNKVEIWVVGEEFEELSHDSMYVNGAQDFTVNCFQGYMEFEGILNGDKNGDKSDAVCGIAMLLLIPLHIVIGIWLYKDATKREKNIVLWSVIGIFAGVIGLIIWLLVRPKR